MKAEKRSAQAFGKEASARGREQTFPANPTL
jgi:hypothetical protein